MNNTKKLTSGQIMLFAAGTLFCLMLLSVSLMSGLYARYTTSGNGSDDARVAKFDVTATVPGVEAKFKNLSPENAEYQILVTNNSEVAVRYDVILTFEKSVKDYLNITLDENTAVFSEDGKTATFANVASLASNNLSGTQTHVLVFSVNWNAVTQPVTEEAVTMDFAFNGTVKCVQID